MWGQWKDLGQSSDAGEEKIHMTRKPSEMIELQESTWDLRLGSLVQVLKETSRASSALSCSAAASCRVHGTRCASSQLFVICEETKKSSVFLDVTGHRHKATPGFYPQGLHPSCTPTVAPQVPVRCQVKPGSLKTLPKLRQCGGKARLNVRSSKAWGAAKVLKKTGRHFRLVTLNVPVASPSLSLLNHRHE